jgi:arylsulfatase A-like enzyme
VAAGRVVESLVSLIDLTPTCLDVAGLEPLAEADGVTFAPLLTDDAKSTRKSIVAERNWHDNFDPMRCIRTERFKLIYNCRPEVAYEPITDLARSPTWRSIVALERDGKLTADMRWRFFQAPRPTFELYDLQADPNETKNLADDPAHAATRNDLTARLSKWMDQTGDFLPPPERAAQSERRYAKDKAAAAATATTRTR